MINLWNILTFWFSRFFISDTFFYLLMSFSFSIWWCILSNSLIGLMPSSYLRLIDFNLLIFFISLSLISCYNIYTLSCSSWLSSLSLFSCICSTLEVIDLCDSIIDYRILPCILNLTWFFLYLTLLSSLVLVNGFLFWMELRLFRIFLFLVWSSSCCLRFMLNLEVYLFSNHFCYLSWYDLIINFLYSVLYISLLGLNRDSRGFELIRSLKCFFS